MSSVVPHFILIMHLLLVPANFQHSPNQTIVWIALSLITEVLPQGNRKINQSFRCNIVMFNCFNTNWMVLYRDNNNVMFGPSPYQVDYRYFHHGKGSGENGNNPLHKETSSGGISISKYKQSTTYPLVNYHESSPELNLQSSAPLKVSWLKL